MHQCVQCGQQFPARIKIDGVEHNLCNRRRCLRCWPFKKLRERKTPEQMKVYNRAKFKRLYKAYKDKFGFDQTRARRVKHKNFLIEHCGGKCTQCSNAELNFRTELLFFLFLNADLLFRVKEFVPAVLI